MENQDTVEFDADAAFEEAANQLESGGLTADVKPPVADEEIQTTPDQRAENTTQESNPQQPEAQEEVLPEWLANATDEVKENFRVMEAEKKRYEHMAKSQRGRVGALSKKYQQAQAALEQLKQNQTTFDGELESLRADYPEVAEFLTRFVAGQNKRIEDISAPIAQMVDANVQDFAQQQLEGSISLVTQAVPEADNILRDPMFHRWVDNQPNGVKALFSSDDPQDAIYLLNEYKRATSSISEQRNKRSQQLSAMSLPTGRTAPKGGDEVNEDALFDQYAALFDKRR
ncbi:hypothetical protein HYE54_01000 [Aggregatibacter actinomycetemcomitans]|uniref:hypothetical protein n=1 Tax=Aggregatibacter actinomycetemcomitans TaxID=714 RepID=UPI00197BF3D5|nr:hypothetical protein [Aggregatibacter actinomycetemcomitans]MBN6067396.1 hypothetical protein [Aggregatibacter actinomycetemcomitans]MBN6086102.1 hypothetical protein [Aggregatibacter actinomycetemcomitans]